MHNIPVSYKVHAYYRAGNVEGLSRLFQRYALILHPPTDLPPHSWMTCIVSPAPQLEIYEILCAEILSRKYWMQHYLIQHTSTVKSKLRRTRSVVMIGPDARDAEQLYQVQRDKVEEQYRKRYYGHYIQKGLSAAVSYRSGFCEGILSATPYPDRNIHEYKYVFEGLRVRTIDSKKRAYSDKEAYNLGFKDGQIAGIV